MNSYNRIYSLLLEARRITRQELEDEAAELVHGDESGNWTYRRAKKAIRKAEAAGTFRLSKKQHKKLQGRGSSAKTKQAKKEGFSRGTENLQDLKSNRKKTGRSSDTKSMRDMAKAVDAGEAPPAVATKHIKTGRLTQRGGRTRHTTSKLMGGKGAEFIAISGADRRKALKSKLRKNRTERQGGYTREPKTQTANPPEEHSG